jgi:Zn-dependent protease with chaperone function
MRGFLRELTVLLLCESLALLPAVDAAARQSPAAAPPAQASALRAHLQKSYLELFELAPKTEFSGSEISSQRAALENGKKMCVARFKTHAKQYQKQLDAAQKNLKAKSPALGDAERKQAHCTIQNLDLLESEANVLANQAIPTAYDNLNAKLDIIQQWPALYKQTQQEIANRSYLNRRWGDVKDIGFREIAANQQEDIKRGKEAIEEMKRAGMLPPEIQDKSIQEYVNSVAQQVARHSDLKIPLQISVLESREINAFALPGGYLFLERGLLEATDDESELAGVIAHEISHDVARHSAKLMKRATIASIFYQAAQIATIILTGGVAGIGLYYAIQYGFYGLGLVLDLKLLGVSRDYELEADQLGVQYAWASGYDPTGFIRFFDKMATKQGYVNGVSWFRTHPPFYQRMVNAEREILFMSPKPAYVVQTSAFEAMKKKLEPITATAQKEEIGKPSLRMTREEGCEPPAKLEYTAGQPIEELCSAPLRTVPPAGPAR